MATNVWPVTLPQSPLLVGYSEQPKDNVLRSQMDYGPDKLRNLTTGIITNVSLRMLLSATQTTTLDNFYHSVLARVGLFGWVNHRTGADANYRFVEPPRYTPVGPKYYGDLTMEMLPGDVIGAIPKTVSSASYTVANADTTIIVDASSNDVTITLPTVSAGFRQLHVKRIDTVSTNTVTIVPTGSETIDGGPQALMTSNEAVTLVNDAVQWYLI